MILSLRQKLAAAFGSALLVLVVGGAALLATRQYGESARLTSHAYQVLAALDALRARMNDATIGVRGFVITGEERFLEPYRDAHRDVAQQLAQLETMTADNPRHRPRLARLDTLVTELFGAFEERVAARRTSGFEAAAAGLGRDKATRDSAAAVIDVIGAEERALLARRGVVQARNASIATLTIAIGSLVAFLLTVAITHAIRTDVTDREFQRERLARQNALLQQRAREVEVQQRQLQDQAAELEASNEELQSTTEELRLRGEEAEQSAAAVAHLAAERSAVLEQLREGVILTDAEGRITFVNEAARQQHGVRRLDVPVEEYSETYHLLTLDGEPHPPTELPLARAVQRAEVVNDTPWKIRRPDGTDILAVGNARPVRDATGKQVGAVLTIRDESARWAAETALTAANEVLAASEARTRAILESSLDAIVTMDEKGVITEWNSAAESIFQWNREQAVGRLLGDLIVPVRMRAAHQQGLARYLATGEARVLGRRIEIQGLRRDGSEFPIELTIARIDSPESVHGLSGFSGIMRDITARLEGESALNERGAELARAVEALERSNLDLDQFAYVASHDLKAPLRGIANLAQWIQEDLEPDVPDQVRKHIALLHGRVGRLEGLIDGVLQYSRAGRARSPVESVDVAALAQEAVDLLAPPPTARVVIDSGLPNLQTERIPLSQVFMNLVGNALKHTRGDDVRITIGGRAADGGWWFFVADNGPGIARRYHDRIFGIFQTLESRDKVEGTGIGLSVVKKLVEGRGGRLEVESAEGTGATFRFFWPAQTSTTTGSLGRVANSTRSEE
jgi:PAS domain S-box-containing protein